MQDEVALSGPAAEDVLARCPLFTELDGQEIAALAAIATRRRYRDGEDVFLAGEASIGLAIVVLGQVAIYVLSPQSGRELVLTVERPYSSVAELAAFDRGPYPANARARGDTELLVLETERLEAVLGQRPRISRHLLHTVGRRLRRLVAVVEQISFQEVVHRLAAHLLERAGGGTTFELGTNADIAAQIGTVPELVSRNLSRLHASGSLVLEGRKVLALDRAALEHLARSASR